MKYLKTYNESKEVIENAEKEVFPIINMVSDMLYEITDDNWDLPKDRFKSKVQAVGPLYNSSCKLGILIEISRQSGFIIKDIEPIVSRINSYLESEGYQRVGIDKFDCYGYNMVYRFKK